MSGPQKIGLYLSLIYLSFAASLGAQGFDYSEIGITVSAGPGVVAPGGFGVLKVVYDVPFGFTLTDTTSTFRIEPNDVEGIRFGALQKPEHDLVDDIGGHWRGSVTFQLFFTVARDAKPGEREITLSLRLQACDEESGLCYRPFDTTRAVAIGIIGQAGEKGTEDEEGRQREAAVGDQQIDEEERPEPPEEATVAGAEEEGEQQTGAVTAAEAPLEESLKDWLDDSLAGGQIWLACLIAFGAGILTSLTPCVYPMIPITISYVSGKAGGKKKNGFFISLVLVAGMAITYTVLGVMAAQAGSTFGAFSQNIWVQLFVAAILILMGFSMLGAFEIGLPASVQQKIQVQRSGYIGALGIGLTIGLVAAPCVAPILIPILTLIATTGNMILGVTLMLVYAFGMGVLFILLGTFSNIILPSSGEWMVWLKKVFAFVLFLVAIFFAQGLLKSIPIPNLFEITLGSVLVLFGAVIGAFHRLEKDAGWWATLGKAGGLLLVTVGLIYFAFGFLKPMLPEFALGSVTVGSPSAPAWVKDLDDGLEQARREGKPVVVDFWAEWCAACRELDEYTFSDPRVLKELERFVVIKVDGTSEDDPEYQAARKRYDVQALPRVIIHDSNGGVARIFDGFRDADTVLAYLRKVQ